MGLLLILLLSFGIFFNKAHVAFARHRLGEYHIAVALRILYTQTVGTQISRRIVWCGAPYQLLVLKIKSLLFDFYNIVCLFVKATFALIPKDLTNHRTALFFAFCNCFTYPQTRIFHCLC